MAGMHGIAAVLPLADGAPKRRRLTEKTNVQEASGHASPGAERMQDAATPPEQKNLTPRRTADTARQPRWQAGEAQMPKPRLPRLQC